MPRDEAGRSWGRGLAAVGGEVPARAGGVRVGRRAAIGAEAQAINGKITRGDLDKWLQSAVEHEVKQCLDQYAVTLGSDVMQELVNSVTGFCLVLEPCYWPGPRYRQDDQWLYDPLSEPEPEPSAPQAAVAE